MYKKQSKQIKIQAVVTANIQMKSYEINAIINCATTNMVTIFLFEI